MTGLGQLAGQALQTFAPDLAKKLVEVRYWRVLARSVKEDSGRRPPLWYRGWLKHPATRSLLLKAPPDLVESLLPSARAANTGQQFRRRSDADVVWLVEHAARRFDESLGANLAGQVAERRDEARHAAVLERLDTVRSEVAAGAQRKEDFFDGLPYGTCRMLNLPEVTVADVSALVMRLRSADPNGAAVDLADRPPSWLTDAAPALTAALAEYCAARGLMAQSARLFEAAGDRPWERSAEMYGRAIVALKEHAGAEAARALLERVQPRFGHLVWLRAAELLVEDRHSDLPVVIAEADALDNSWLGVHRAQGLALHQHFDDALELLGKLRDRHPQSAVIELVAARCWLARASQLEADSRLADRQASLAAALRGRDLVRLYGGSREDYIEAAIEAALASRDYGRVHQLCSTPPDGEATADEADYPAVATARLQVAAGLGLPTFEHEAIPEFERLLADTFSNGLSIVEAAALWGAAGTEDQKVRAWLAAIDHDVDPLPGADDLAQQSDHVRDFLEAHRALHGDDVETAMRLLRRHPEKYLCARRIAVAHAMRDEWAEAGEQARRNAKQFNEPTDLSAAADHFLRAGRPQDAHECAVEALMLIPLGDRHRIEAHRSRARALLDLGRPADLEVAARQWELEIASDEPRWFVAFAQYRQGRLDKAWATIGNMEPATELAARLWVALQGEFGNDVAAATAVLRTQQRFPESEDLARQAVMAVLSITSRLSDEEGLPAEFEPYWHELLQAHTGEQGSGAPLEKIMLPGDPAGVIDVVASLLRSRYERLEHVADAVRESRVPLGLFAKTVSRPLASVLVQGGEAGLAVIADGPPGLVERNAVVSALGKSVVIDLSVIHVVSIGVTVRSRLKAMFSDVSVPMTDVLDLAQGESQARWNSAGTATWDPVTERVVFYEANAEDTAAVRARLADMRSIMDGLEHITWSDVAQVFPDLDEDWITALAYAKAHNLPLWSDDLALRRLAASVGVPAFGTLALAATAVDEGVLAANELTDLIDVLFDEGFVDLPLPAGLLLEKLSSSDWTSRQVLAALRRARTWQVAEPPAVLYSRVLDGAASTHPADLPVWVTAICEGITHAVGSENAAKFAHELVTFAVYRVGVDAETCRSIVEGCRSVLRRVGSDLNLAEVTRQMVAVLEPHLPADHQAIAATYITTIFRLLGEEDRRVVSSELLGLR